MKTPEDFKEQALKHNIKYWKNNNCSICNCPNGFIFEQDNVFFDSQSFTGTSTITVPTHLDGYLLCDNFIALYNSHFSNKPNPQIPNVNIKKFHDLIDNLYDKYVGKVQEDMQTKIEQLLNDTNLNIKYMIETPTALQNIPKLKYTDKSLQKCIKSDCYLFLYKLDILEKYI